MAYGKKVVENLKYHAVDTTALLVSTNPIYAAMEVGIAGMSDQLSIDSRLTVAGISYAGMGLAFARGRDFSRKVFKITGETSEKIQVIHDVAYTSAFNLVVSPGIYLAMGADVKQAVVGGLSAAALSVGMGPIMGYSVDVARDLTGLRECERKTYPDFIKKQSGGVKKGLVALLTAGSIAAMAGIYALTPEREISLNERPAIERVDVSDSLENSREPYSDK